ncbi:hypothetical protein GGTG_05991 [Gaeumannomyces tritici R3-111a-1]|uniref:Uncharacterized protein n=1 Tax=Gaeumannomyces tritici (strain R3-111a-1) TaxID=644352 RepID=J3NXI5_GAET3|nr:hypothetical protein GGTG_05991 [Gaeumannomyces tritici R3-111a-1]EJT76067.1 hypothetical protein GGTG_05991 [Gaeumannomyces tritici R3-111a-1]
MFAIGLLAIGAIPTTIGVGQAISAQKRQNAAQKEQAKFHLTAKLSLGGRPPMEAMIVLKDNKLWIDHQESPVEGHKFTGYYFTYPSEEQHKGIVSTISIDPPMLNWIYVDKDTATLRYGGRKDTLSHVIGPWWWSEDETYLTLRGSADGFVAEEDPSSRKWFLRYSLPQQQQKSGDRHHRDRVCAEGEGPSYSGDEVSESDGESDDQEEDYDGGEGGYDDSSEEDEDEDEDGEEEEGCSGPRRVRVQLRRRMMLGMDSRYVKRD